MSTSDQTAGDEKAGGDGPGDTPDERAQRKKYEEVSGEDVADDAIEFFGEGNDDESPAIPADRKPDPDLPPPPNA